MENAKIRKKNLYKQLPFNLKLQFSFWGFKRKMKEIVRDKNKIVIWLIFFVAFMSVLSGVAVFATFIHNLNKTYTIWGNGSIEVEKSGQVGDFIGGVVGALWSFTGTLLFFVALQLQRTELIEMRKESQVNRLTDIIYKQLDYFDKNLQNFKLVDIDKNQSTHTGAYAITILRSKVESILDINKEINEDKKRNIAIKFYAETIALVSKNEESLLNLFEALDSSCDVIRAVLFKDTIPPADLNELKALFFRNIHRDLLNSAKHLSFILEAYLSKKEKAGEKREYFLAPLERLISKINVVIEFREFIYDKENTKRNDDERDMYNRTQV